MRSSIELLIFIFLFLPSFGHAGINDATTTGRMPEGDSQMNVNELKSSKFLKRTDVGAGVLVTISGVEQINVAKDGAPEELKWCCHFQELDKPMVLNNTNGQIIAQVTKSEESDDWVGKQVVLYDDPSVSFGGKLVGGIRVRAPRIKAAAKPTPAPVAPAAAQGDDDNLPF